MCDLQERRLPMQAPVCRDARCIAEALQEEAQQALLEAMDGLSRAQAEASADTQECEVRARSSANPIHHSLSVITEEGACDCTVPLPVPRTWDC